MHIPREEREKTMKRNAGYKIDFTTNTLIVNCKFYEASQVYGSPENNLVKKIKEDFPNLMISVEKGRNAKTAHPRSRLTYSNMEKHIQAYDNAAELLAMFEKVKLLSKPLASPYKYVADWFILQFPHYRSAESALEHRVIALASLPNIKDYKPKAKKENNVVGLEESKGENAVNQ